MQLLDYFHLSRGVGVHIYSGKRASELSGFFLLKIFDSPTLICMMLAILSISTYIHIRNNGRIGFSEILTETFGAVLTQGGARVVNNNPSTILIFILALLTYASFSGLIVSMLVKWL